MEYNVRKLPQGYVVQDSANGFEDLAAFTTLEDALSWLQERFAEDQPIDDGWVKWSGGLVEPVGERTPVEVRFRDGESKIGEAGEFYGWNPDAQSTLMYPDKTIVAYRVIR